MQLWIINYDLKKNGSINKGKSPMLIELVYILSGFNQSSRDYIQSNLIQKV